MFLEHDDLYQGGGHQHILFGPKLVEPPGACRSNHDLICALAERVGAQHEGFGMSARDIIDWTLRHSGWGDLANLEAKGFIDVQPAFEHAHYLKTVSAGRTAVCISGRPGRTCPSPMTARWVPSPRSRRFPITGR
jgi:anaerobic selenocysteine-containing dehydrogenase